jgi:hypothetical protein
MKKIKLFGLGLLLSISLLSCSNDGGSPANSSSLILPKKISTGEGTSNQSDTYFTYNGNKIVSEITDVQYKTVYTYTGNFITKIEKFNYAELDQTTDFTYTNGKLTSVFYQESLYPEYNVMRNYVHNSDSTVLYNNGILTFENGNLIEDASENNGTTTYEYDTKSNPFKNVLGIGLLLEYSGAPGLVFTMLSSPNSSSKNNCIKGTDYYNGNTSVLFTRTITYNSNGYPIEEYYGSSDYGSVKYYYE